MVCLVCLRNEGINFPIESQNDLEILLGLFELPQEFSQTLEGNKCCSLCRVKLGFVEVIKQEIGILSEKLKCFKEEVKGIFVSSFDGHEEAIESNETFELAIQARKKLFKVLDFPVEIEEFEQTTFQHESQISGIEIKEFESQWQPDHPSENSEIPLSDPLQVQPVFNSVEFEQNEEFPTPESFYVEIPKIPKDEPMSSNNLIPNQYYSEIETSHVEQPIPAKSKFTMARRLKFAKAQFSKTRRQYFEKNRDFTIVQTRHLIQGKSPTSGLNPNISQSSLNRLREPEEPATPLLNPEGHKLRKSLCLMCKPKAVFERPEEFEEHLKNVHPSRPYSKCPKCPRIIPEVKEGTNTRLKIHLREVHPPARPFKCDHCKAAFKSMGTLKTHSEIHLDREMYICEHCDYRLLGLRNFNLHLKKHK